jgi:hypothetical protein
LAGSIRLATSGQLAMDNLSKTTIAKKAREQRRKGARRITQRGGVIYIANTRSMASARATKEALKKATAEVRAQ